jgi:hypothetical protein
LSNRNTFTFTPQKKNVHQPYLELVMTTANGSPAKRFFVEMLTRDIELADAILDLLDNCVDGALRAGATDSKLPYKGFSASIELSSKLFQIQDNCGGIPRSIAEKYAFRFGRKERERDKDLATVGVYGIGMKRAIFKLGTNCVIDSKHDKESFSVTIDQDWINNDENWSFDMSDTSVHQKKPGTTIRVDQLHPQVQIAFSAGKDGFVDNFSQIVQRHYSYIIEKGFEILVNDKRVSASTIQTCLTLLHTRAVPGLAHTCTKPNGMAWTWSWLWDSTNNCQQSKNKKRARKGLGIKRALVGQSFVMIASWWLLTRQD